MIYEYNSDCVKQVSRQISLFLRQDDSQQMTDVKHDVCFRPRRGNDRQSAEMALAWHAGHCRSGSERGDRIRVRSTLCPANH